MNLYIINQIRYNFEAIMLNVCSASTGYTSPLLDCALLCLAGTHGEVRLPAENGEDLEENLEETLVCP